MGTEKFRVIIEKHDALNGRLHETEENEDCNVT